MMIWGIGLSLEQRLRKRLQQCGDDKTMKIEIKKIKENKDGSADVDVSYDKEGLKFLVQQGLIATMVEAIVQQSRGNKYNVSDILGTLPKKSSKKSGRKIVEPTKQTRPRRSPKGSA